MKKNIKKAIFAILSMTMLIGSANAAATLITSGKGVGGTAPTTGSLDTTGATLLVAVVTYTGTVTGMSDSKGNTWTGLTAYANSGVTSRIYYVNSNTPTVGTGHTFTYTASGGANVINVMAFSGTAANPFDVENGNNSASAATIQPGSVTPSKDDNIVITGFSGGNTYGGAGTIDLGFTITDNSALVGGTNYGSAAAYLIQTAATARNPTWTLGSTVSNIASSIAVFKVDASGVTTASTNNKNARIASAAPTTALSDTAGLYIMNRTTNKQRSLISFTTPNLSGTITAVKMCLYANNVGSGNNTGYNHNLHQVTQTAWTQAAVTWNTYDGSNNWSTSGGDYNATIIDAIAEPTSVNTWYCWDIYGGSSDNPITINWNSTYDFIVKSADEAGAWSDAYARVYNGKSAASNKPYLEITYTSGGTASSPSTLGFFRFFKKR